MVAGIVVVLAVVFLFVFWRGGDWPGRSCRRRTRRYHACLFL